MPKTSNQTGNVEEQEEGGEGSGIAQMRLDDTERRGLVILEMGFNATKALTIALKGA